MNVVSIMAHQDDEMVCLGTMLRCQQRGDRLHFITLTDGSGGFGGKPISREKAAGIRQVEMNELAASLDAEYINIGEQDGFLYDTPAVRKKLMEAIRKTKADLIFTGFRDDYNQDHVTTNALVKHCAMIASVDVQPTESAPLAGHPAVFEGHPHGHFPFQPTHYVDISEVIEKKAKALSCHVSQEKSMFDALGTGLREMAEVTSRYRGYEVGVTHAEAFMPMQARGSLKAFRILP